MTAAVYSVIHYHAWSWYYFY